MGHGIDSVLDLDEPPPSPDLPAGVEQRIVRGADAAASEAGVDAFLAGCSLMPTAEGSWFIGSRAAPPRGRGRGLARTVKQIAHRYAFDAGAPAVRTTNEERNGRMGALNASLG